MDTLAATTAQQQQTASDHSAGPAVPRRHDDTGTATQRTRRVRTIGPLQRLREPQEEQSALCVDTRAPRPASSLPLPTAATRGEDTRASTNTNTNAGTGTDTSASASANTGADIRRRTARKRAVAPLRQVPLPEGEPEARSSEPPHEQQTKFSLPPQECEDGNENENDEDRDGINDPRTIRPFGRQIEVPAPLDPRSGSAPLPETAAQPQPKPTRDDLRAALRSKLRAKQQARMGPRCHAAPRPAGVGRACNGAGASAAPLATAAAAEMRPDPALNRALRKAARKKGIAAALTQAGITDPGVHRIVEDAARKGELGNVNRMAERIYAYLAQSDREDGGGSIGGGGGGDERICPTAVTTSPSRDSVVDASPPPSDTAIGVRKSS